MDHRRRQAGPRLRAFAFAAVVAVLLGGCATERVVVPQGKTGIAAAYDGFGLDVNLPARVPVPSAIIAGEQALLRRGNTVTAMESTAEGGRVVARPPSRRLHSKITIVANQVGGATAMRIEVEPFGDEAACRSILDDMLVRLGL